ncbi:MAG: peptide deformylase [Patescibacteria group bacterium]|jgi:peptide deformylase
MPKQLPIITNPNPILRKKSLEISADKINSREFQELLLDMEETMIKKDGAGLAAPQIGQNIRALVVSDGKKTLFLINPQITKKSWAREIAEEGCLSVLNDQGEIIYALVERYKKINCVYWNKKGLKTKLKADKMLARVIQHEVDHLDGILFIDKIAKK